MKAAAKRIRVTTLLVRGAVSDVVSVAAANLMRALIPHAESVDVAGAGHMVAGDRNDAFNCAVIAFLDHLLGPGAQHNLNYSESI